MKHSVILADPAWRYQNWTDAANGAAASAYETMLVEEIAAIPVAAWAAKDAVLTLWTTWPKLDEGLRVLEAWGFSYVTGLPWVKVTPSSGEIYRGIGFWTQSASEVLLIGRRGELRRADGVEPVMGLLHGEQRVFYAPRTKHSAKPLEVHGWLEALFPGATFLELFARLTRPGWTCWGLELGFRLGADGVTEVEATGGPPDPEARRAARAARRAAGAARDAARKKQGALFDGGSSS